MGISGFRRYCLHRVMIGQIDYHRRHQIRCRPGMSDGKNRQALHDFSHQCGAGDQLLNPNNSRSWSMTRRRYAGAITQIGRVVKQKRRDTSRLCRNRMGTVPGFCTGKNRWRSSKPGNPWRFKNRFRVVKKMLPKLVVSVSGIATHYRTESTERRKNFVGRWSSLL